MKRYLIAGGVGTMVFAAALGSASMLSIDAGVAQTGTQALTGDSDGVVVDSWGYESDNNSSYSIRITDVDSKLSGKTMWAQVYDGGGSVVGKGKADIAGSTVTVRWANPIAFEKIEKLRLTVE